VKQWAASKLLKVPRGAGGDHRSIPQPADWHHPAAHCSLLVLEIRAGWCFQAGQGKPGQDAGMLSCAAAAQLAQWTRTAGELLCLLVAGHTVVQTASGAGSSAVGELR
jgi:hypothetical protein